MIPNNVITAWATTHPWPSRLQLEQDLLLSRVLIEIANDPFLGKELIFRGGTALHKLHLPTPLRYSEDLDYVRTTDGGITNIFRALQSIGDRAGFITSTQITQQPKVYFRTESADGKSIKIKVEINTYERSRAFNLTHITHAVNTTWFTSTADVLTFDIAELVATKIRALYQRSKGRDLFDLWLALSKLGIEPERILEAFVPYQPAGLTAKESVANMRRKLADKNFRTDIDLLARTDPPSYDIDEAGELIINKLLKKIPHPLT